MKQKYYKGEKYIYLLMGFKLAMMAKDHYVKIGNDNGMVGGQNYERMFEVFEYQDKLLLKEKKYSASSADFSRVFQIGFDIEKAKTDEKPSIYDYMNENNENCGQRWEH